MRSLTQFLIWKNKQNCFSNCSKFSLGNLWIINIQFLQIYHQKWKKFYRRMIISFITRKKAFFKWVIEEIFLDIKISEIYQNDYNSNSFNLIKKNETVVRKRNFFNKSRSLAIISFQNLFLFLNKPISLKKVK